MVLLKRNNEILSRVWRNKWRACCVRNLLDVLCRHQFIVHNQVTDIAGALRSGPPASWVMTVNNYSSTPSVSNSVKKRRGQQILRPSASFPLRMKEKVFNLKLLRDEKVSYKYDYRIQSIYHLLFVLSAPQNNIFDLSVQKVPKPVTIKVFPSKLNPFWRMSCELNPLWRINFELLVVVLWYHFKKIKIKNYLDIYTIWTSHYVDCETYWHIRWIAKPSVMGLQRLLVKNPLLRKWCAQ